MLKIAAVVRGAGLLCGTSITELSIWAELADEGKGLAHAGGMPNSPATSAARAWRSAAS